MREQEMASVHFLEKRSRVSEDRYALGDLKQCMTLSQRYPSRSRVIQKEASVNFRSRIPALATPVCALPPTTSPHLCELKAALCHLKKNSSYIWHFSQGEILSLSVHRCRRLGDELL